MLLAAVDIGNSRSKIGFFRGKRLVRTVALPTRALNSSKVRKADVVALASVHPKAERRLKHPALKKMGKHFPPAVGVDVDRPREVGMDRLANAAGAWARAKRACIVVDVGTAITFDAVDRRGRFVGGLIAPGMVLGSRALSDYAALLPHVPPAKPKRVLGRDTKSNIRSGLYWATAGLIECGLRQARKELGGRPVVIGTGGDAPLFRKLFDRLVPELTLEGIRISYVTHCESDHRARPRRDRRR